MSPSALLAQPATAAEPTVASVLAPSHDRSMAQCDRMLGPVMDPWATFFQRWGALWFVSEQLQERYDLEQKLLDELLPVIAPAMRDRLRLQGEQVSQLRQDVQRLAAGRSTARDLARAVEELVQVLRLWYAEIEFGLGEVRRDDIGSRANQILDQLNYRPVFKS